MRELKFRAWDKSRKTMGFKYADFSVKNGVLVAENYGPDGNIQQLPIMQFTGLRDCNGVDVYEGDVVTRDDYPFVSEGLVNYRGEVYFDENALVWAVAMHVISDRVRGAACGFSLNEHDDYRVIGNIHENPELLEAQT